MFEKEQSTAYIYISKTFSSMHFNFFYHFNAFTFMCIAINGTASRNTRISVTSGCMERKKEHRVLIFFNMNLAYEF